MDKVKQARTFFQQYPTKITLFALVWMGIGLIGSMPFFNSFYQKFLLLQYPPMERSVGYWGADWEVYQFLADKTENSDSILFLSPNSYYFSRLILHLYPTPMEYVSNPKDALMKKLREYDYVFVYIPLEQSSGAIPGLTGNITSWDVRELMILHNQLAPKEPINAQEEMIALVEKTKGVLLYSVELK